ncbi:MAG: inorganic phosphate transporter, partial [Bacteroidetes bacterium]|nr:inorganic phosphate transporter [Bacteroidota bacterium]
MEFFVIILVILLAAAVIDLMVGVANDAVNFLNSAIGAKVASRMVIMIIATLGIVAGVTFSSGLMEVARSGIFNPHMLTFPEVMFIFVATMLTDVILLDFYNTFGLPTSTTVSLVFELLGAAFAISFIKVMHEGGGLAEALAYINTGSVLRILFGIVASIIVAFIAGATVQYFSRMLFTFDFGKRLRRYGAVWGGFALAAITYFILVKGAKGASFLTDADAEWLKANTLMIAGISFLLWSLLLLILQWTIKLNVFKPIVLAGTFALAMAFAANDLVNFIGAPLAGLASFRFALDAPDPLSMTMEALAEPVRANTWILLIAGTIMAATLLVNKKARTVTATSVNLGRQSEGFERFESIAPARAIVRFVLAIFNFISLITPERIRKKVAQRFDTSKYKPVPADDGELPAFDLLRAAVNLIVAALLVSFGTSLKLPLSTTYVTFMVAMATALPDRAWGRDSAVYRISGVLTVIGGWFFTALVAATVAAIIATIIFYTEIFGLIAIAGLAAFLLYRTISVHKRREKGFADQERRYNNVTANVDDAIADVETELGTILMNTVQVVNQTHEGLSTENRTLLKESTAGAKHMHKEGKTMAATILRASQLEVGDESIDNKNYAEVNSSLQLLLRSLRNMSTQCYIHVDNNHRQLSEVQREELELIVREVRGLLMTISDHLLKADFSSAESISLDMERVRTLIRKSDKQQLKRSKKEKYTSRSSLLYLEMLTEYEEIVYHAESIFRQCRKCHNGPEDFGDG